MIDSPDRRTILAAGAGLFGVGAVAVAATDGSTPDPEGKPAETDPPLISVLDTSADDGVTEIAVLDSDGDTVFVETVSTAGTQTSAGESESNRATLESFGDLPRGFYTVRATHDGSSDSTEVQVVGPGELVDGNTIRIKIGPAGSVRVTASHGDPYGPA